MSLLSGIRFIPSSEREGSKKGKERRNDRESSSDSSDSDSDSSDSSSGSSSSGSRLKKGDKKHRKGENKRKKDKKDYKDKGGKKSDKKKKKEKKKDDKKSSSRKRERSSTKNAKDYNDASANDFDYSTIPSEEECLRLMQQYEEEEEKSHALLLQGLSGHSSSSNKKAKKLEGDVKDDFYKLLSKVNDAPEEYGIDEQSSDEDIHADKELKLRESESNLPAILQTGRKAFDEVDHEDFFDSHNISSTHSSSSSSSSSSAKGSLNSSHLSFGKKTDGSTTIQSLQGKFNKEGSIIGNVNSNSSNSSNSSNNNINNNNKSNNIDINASNKSVAEQLRMRLKANNKQTLNASSSSTTLPSDKSSTQVADKNKNIESLVFIDRAAILSSKDINRVSSNGDGISNIATSERLQNDNMDEVFARNIIRMGGRYEGNTMGKSVGSRSGRDEEEEDGDIDMSYFQNDGLDSKKLEARQRQIAINEQKRQNSIQDKCLYCVGSQAFDRHQKYVIHSGSYCQVRLKRGGARLHDFHCEIVPLQHVVSIRQCEEDIMVEVNQVKAKLRRLAELHGLSALFTESAIKFRSGNHVVLDCVPVDAGKEQDARTTFREALLAASDEWATHKKLITMSRDKQLHFSIPPQFEYVCMEWGDDANSEYGGLVHVIETSSTREVDAFDWLFGLDVISGMLEEDPMRIRIKAKVDEAEEDAVIKRFAKYWKG